MDFLFRLMTASRILLGLCFPETCPRSQTSAEPKDYSWALALGVRRDSENQACLEQGCQTVWSVGQEAGKWDEKEEDAPAARLGSGCLSKSGWVQRGSILIKLTLN